MKNGLRWALKMWVSMWWTGKHKGMGIEIYSVGMMAKGDK